MAEFKVNNGTGNLRNGRYNITVFYLVITETPAFKPKLYDNSCKKKTYFQADFLPFH